MSRSTLPAEYFDALYAADDDPWRIGVGFYEQRKRALTLAALPDPHYATVVEIGCGNGELSLPLAARCDRLIALDTAARAVERAKRRTAALDHVEVRHASVPSQCPDEPFDAVVLSEVGYYLTDADLTATLDRLLASARPGAVLLAVHWRHEAADYPQSGDEVHAVIAARPELVPFASYADDDVLLDVHTVGPRPSVARAQGVL